MLSKLKITKAQVLHVLLILVVAPVSGTIAAVLAKSTVLPHYSASEITIVFLGGATWAVGLGFHYLRNNAWWEKHVAGVVDLEDDGQPSAGGRTPAALPEPGDLRAAAIDEQRTVVEDGQVDLDPSGSPTSRVNERPAEEPVMMSKRPTGDVPPPPPPPPAG